MKLVEGALRALPVFLAIMGQQLACFAGKPEKIWPLLDAPEGLAPIEVQHPIPDAVFPKNLPAPVLPVRERSVFGFPGAGAACRKWSVGRALTFISMTCNAGAVIGPLIGGSVAERYGFQTVYFIAAVLFVISTLAVLMVRPQPRDHHDPDHPPAALLRNRRNLTFLAVFFFVAFAAYIPQPLSSNYLRNQQELSLTAIGQLRSIAYLGSTILALVLGQLQARTGFLLGQVGVAAFAVLLWRGLGFGWFAVGYFLLGDGRLRDRMAGRAGVRH